MTRYMKIGADIVNIDSITRISVVENQSGISDRIIIEVGTSEVVIDSALGGRERMNAIRDRLLATLSPEDWDAGEAIPPAQAA